MFKVDDVMFEVQNLLSSDPKRAPPPLSVLS